MSIQTVAVLGAGNGGCAVAGDLTLRNYDVRLFSRSAKTLAPLVSLGGIEFVEEGKVEFACPARITASLAEAVEGADLIVVAAPASAHEYLAKALAQHVAEHQRILLNPGHTGGSFHFSQLLRTAGASATVKICETVTLSYICRMPQPARVEVYRRTAHLCCAAFPAKDSHGLIEDVQRVFPNIVPAENVLETGFSNINAIMHPAGMVGNAGWIEKTGGDFLFYREGITCAVAEWIGKVDEERVQIVERLGLAPLSFVDIFHRAGLTSDEARRSGSIYRAINESAPNRTIKSPPTLNHRYINEDVGYGLVPMAEIGGIVGVETPVMDALVLLASVANRIDYRREGLTLEKMGLLGSSAEDLRDIVQNGF